MNGDKLNGETPNRAIGRRSFFIAGAAAIGTRRYPTAGLSGRTTAFRSAISVWEDEAANSLRWSRS